MPSHIFTRLGLWDEVITTNRGVVTARSRTGLSAKRSTAATIRCSVTCRSGDLTRAREFYAALVTMAPQSRRQEVQHARDILAKQP